MANPVHDFKTPHQEQRSARTSKYEEWYTRVKAAMPQGLQIHSSDMDNALESALRRRGRQDNLGLSIERVDHPHMGAPDVIVKLFPKGTAAPGRTKYIAQARGTRVMSVPVELDIVEFIVPRRARGETTIAVVRAEVSRRDTDLLDVHRGPDKFRDRLTTAVTKWVAETAEGLAAWKASSEDFNVGDLADHISDPDLRMRCTDAGIHNLQITTYGHTGAADWMYDDILVNEAALEERDG